jgi:hypothetical protein
METLQELKQQLLETIAGIEDYNVLLALKDDVALYQNGVEEGPYDFPGATEEEREELIRLDNGREIDEKDCLSLEDFKATMSRWRMK